MSAQNWGRIFWYGVWFGVLFLPFELTGLEKIAPWPTLSATIQHDVAEFPWFAAIILTVCLGLGIHWLFDQRLWPSLFCALCVALNLHFLNNRWP